MFVSIKTFVVTVFACFFYLCLFSQSPRIVVPFRSGNKWGYSDTLGNIKIKPGYDTVSLFDYDMVYKVNHVFAEVRLNGRPMMINERGTTVVPPKYNYVKLIEGLEQPTFIISFNNKFGLFAKGKELFPAVSDWLSGSYPGLYEVHINKKYGLINNKGEVLIPAVYDLLRQRNNQKPDSIEYQCIVFGKEPEVVKIKVPKENWLSQKPPQFEQLDEFSYQNLYKLVDSATKKFGFDSVQMKYHTAVVYKGEKRGILLPDTKETVSYFSKPYEIDHVKYFSPPATNNENKNSAVFVVAILNGKYGMINEREERILPFIYDGIEEKDGFFLLKQNGRIGFYLWNTVYPAIEPAYDSYLSKQYILVNNEWRFTLFEVMKNGKTGFVGENGIPYFKD